MIAQVACKCKLLWTMDLNSDTATQQSNSMGAVTDDMHTTAALKQLETAPHVPSPR